METFKQIMGFLLLGALIFLFSVVGQQGGVDAMYAALVLLFFCSLAAWIYGRWGAPHRSSRSRWTSRVVALLLLAASLYWTIGGVNRAYDQFYADSSSIQTADAQGSYFAPWSEAAVAASLDSEQPVFVDFTAAWCLICQVNKKRVLDVADIREQFANAGIRTYRADWTRYDPEITAALESFGRSGVPLYVLYRPDGSSSVLPQTLSKRIVTEAIEGAR